MKALAAGGSWRSYAILSSDGEVRGSRGRGLLRLDRKRDRATSAPPASASAASASDSAASLPKRLAITPPPPGTGSGPWVGAGGSGVDEEQDLPTHFRPALLWSAGPAGVGERRRLSGRGLVARCRTVQFELRAVVSAASRVGGAVTNYNCTMSSYNNIYNIVIHSSPGADKCLADMAVNLHVQR